MKILAFVVSGSMLLVSASMADGPRISAGPEQEIAERYLAAPRHYDVFYGKKDRQYLTGMWKLRWEWNFLTKAWIEENMRLGKSHYGKALRLKEGIRPPRKEIAAGPEHLELTAEVADW